MERYKDEPFVVGTTNGQLGYEVFQLDADDCPTLIYSKIPTRRLAEKVARHLAHRGLSATHIKFHISLDVKQEEMRRRQDLVSGSASGTTARIRPYSIDELTELHGLSRRTVIELYENEPGVQILYRPETLHKRRFRTIHVPPYVYERVKLKLETHEVTSEQHI